MRTASEPSRAEPSAEGLTNPHDVPPLMAQAEAPSPRSLEESPDVDFVAELAGAPRAAARAFLEEAAEDRDLATALATNLRAGGREFYAQIRAPFELYALVRLLRPVHLVEVGVSSGVSSSYFLRALQRNGHGTLHSIDLPTPQKGSRFSAEEDSPVALPPGRSSGWAVPADLREGWDLRVGRSQELLGPLLAELPEVRLFLHDDEHTFENATREFRTVLPKVPAGGVILADNTNWLDGALDIFARDLGVKTVCRKGLELCGVRRSRTG
jgi:hypothetical protein